MTWPPQLLVCAGPQEASGGPEAFPCSFHTTCDALAASDLVGDLTVAVPPVAGAQSLHWLKFPAASQHPCCLWHEPGPRSPVSGECLEGQWPGLGSQGVSGASETVVEADVAPASPREKRWGTLLSVVGALLQERVGRAWGT